MPDQIHSSSSRFRFSLRGVLVLIGLLALAFAWMRSIQSLQTRLMAHSKRSRYMSEELQRSRDQVKELLRSRDQPDVRDATRVLYAGRLDGSVLRGMTLSSLTNAFQKCSFRDCDLEGSKITGGDCAFQSANFDGANLVNAKLAGGAAAFQLATFVGADLSGATLTGGGASLQSVSFEKATLVGAKLVGDAQNLNISETRFEGADLSSISAANLQSCYFEVPPTYDSATQFPKGFDPVSEKWRLATE